jgi:5'-3' exonuclease
MRGLIFLLCLALIISCTDDLKTGGDENSITRDIDTLALINELDSIFELDQKYRAEMQSVQNEFGWNSDEMNELWTKQRRIDSSNLQQILEVIESVGGYPGQSLVGHSASKTTFYVLQHAPDSVQEKYYEMIVDAAKKNELKRELAAMYQDRYLMHKGEPQIFGTQVRIEYDIDSLTGEKIERTYVWPIADTTNIDSLRLWNGLNNLEEYLNNFGISRWD